jgi:hypothetical protein
MVLAAIMGCDNMELLAKESVIIQMLSLKK